MPHFNDRLRENRDLWLSMVLSAVLPMLLGFIFANLFSDWRLTHYPVHSMVESVGALSALSIATLTVLMVVNFDLPRRYIWVACALIGMGILDGFHAVLHASDLFVWLHSMATIIGGVTFAAIWLPDVWLTTRRQHALILTFICGSLLIGLFSVASPEMVPAMIVNGQFSLLAKAINLLGGIGFLMGTAYFAHLYRKSFHGGSDIRLRSEDLVFANHCLLFGIASLLFELSVIWDAGWWWWHILRLAAYLVVLVYFFTLFKQQQDHLSANERKLSRSNKELEQRVYQRTSELEKASKAKSDFLHNMSHELRTPMNAIIGFGQLLEFDEKLNSDHKDMVNEILHASKHLMEIIDEILDLTKIEEGKTEIHSENVDLTEILTESLSMVHPYAKQNNVEIINNISPDSGHTVYGDSLRIKQVFINLLSNAIKYNSANGLVTIDLDLSIKQRARISIKDTGPGIPSDKIDRLFTPFERLGCEHMAIEGTGVGLALSKKLIQLMDGDITVHSILSEGSTFFIELPYQGMCNETM